LSAPNKSTTTRARTASGRHIRGVDPEPAEHFPAQQKLVRSCEDDFEVGSTFLPLGPLPLHLSLFSDYIGCHDHDFAAVEDHSGDDSPFAAPGNRGSQSQTAVGDVGGGSANLYQDPYNLGFNGADRWEMSWC
jgi:hypothetical protein